MGAVGQRGIKYQWKRATNVSRAKVMERVKPLDRVSGHKYHFMVIVQLKNINHSDLAFYNKQVHF